MRLLDRLAAALSFTQSPEWATYDVVQRGLRANQGLAEAGLIVYSAIRGTAAERAQVSDAIKEAYRLYIEPYDIPKVGTFVESLIDAQAPTILAAGPDVAAEWLDKVLPRPSISETPSNASPPRLSQQSDPPC